MEQHGALLYEDMMKSTKSMAEGADVLLYQGLFDLRDGVVAMEAWVREMEWKGRKRFAEAERKVWKMSGYAREFGRLSHVVVSGAGHMVPADQGGSSQVMIEDWVRGRKGLVQHHSKSLGYE